MGLVAGCQGNSYCRAPLPAMLPAAAALAPACCRCALPGTCTVAVLGWGRRRLHASRTQVHRTRCPIPAEPVPITALINGIGQGSCTSNCGRYAVLPAAPGNCSLPGTKVSCNSMWHASDCCCCKAFCPALQHVFRLAAEKPSRRNQAVLKSSIA